MDGDASLVVMATVALVGEDVLGLGGLVAQVAEQLVHGRGEGVSIVGIAKTCECIKESSFADTFIAKIVGVFEVVQGELEPGIDGRTTVAVMPHGGECVLEGIPVDPIREFDHCVLRINETG